MKYFELKFNLLPNDSQDARDLLGALLAEVGFETFTDSENGIDAYIQQPLWDEAAVQSLITDFPMEVRISYTRAEAGYQNWNEQWEAEGFEPVSIANDICIHDTRHDPSTAARYDITINPRMAFGSGTHPTTQMILTELLGLPLEGKRVMDAGCGTGVLGILAMQRGASHILAYDIDEWSTENTELNFALNGFQQVDIRQGDSKCVQGERDFDLVLANINRNILLADMPVWQQTLAQGGELLVSGFYESDADAVLNKARELGLEEKSRRISDGWCLLRLGA
ncbi:MAG: 50S ribosomal protein L11 methyltransferase [Bacteroidaceae bacterium]|nr:50S ribosomal protein L11 methyltransferase [Bacteroidaceae bacterium]